MYKVGDIVKWTQPLNKLLHGGPLEVKSIVHRVSAADDYELQQLGGQKWTFYLPVDKLVEGELVPSKKPMDLSDEREALGRLIKFIKSEESKHSSPVVQELVLARRHMEDARMRLGVALTYANDKDPWKS